MKILLVGGSASKNSHTAGLLKYISDVFQHNGADVELWDLSDRPLPLSQSHWHHDPKNIDNATVKEFVQSIKDADALVLGTPLYHGSYSGILKNALDCLGSDNFKDKMVGLVSNASNIRKAHQPCLHLVTIVQTLYGTPTQTQIGTCKEDYDQNGDNFVVKNPEIKQRCQRLVDEILGSKS